MNKKVSVADESLSIFCCLVKATNAGSCGRGGGLYLDLVTVPGLASSYSLQTLMIVNMNINKLGFSYNGTGRIHGVYNHPRVFLVPFIARPNTTFRLNNMLYVHYMHLLFII